jgi:hypothetical protein
LEASLVNVTGTDARPLLRGAKVTVKPTLCPAAITAGNESPLMVNSELPALADKTDMLEPVAVSFPV